jgi:hypothetical protein
MWMQRWLEPQMFFKMKAEDHIEAMDTNGDGKVEWSEFASFMKPHIEAAMKEHGDHNLAMSLPEGPNDGRYIILCTVVLRIDTVPNDGIYCVDRPSPSPRPPRSYPYHHISVGSYPYHHISVGSSTCPGILPEDAKDDRSIPKVSGLLIEVVLTFNAKDDRSIVGRERQSYSR